MEDPLKLPNWQLSICSPTSSIIKETTKSSKTLDKIGVKEIGGVSLSHRGCFTFGMGMMLEHFHGMGTSPVESDVLKIFVTGSLGQLVGKFFNYARRNAVRPHSLVCFYMQKLFACKTVQ